MSATGEAGFAFKPGDLVLVKWNDSMVYFAKIKKIDQRRRKCVVVFDDKSHDEADFHQIHNVDETTTDIICIKCKRDDSDTPNEIVLCDRCGIGYHQKCHVPPIPASALELDTPWNCTYCLRGVKCPYLTESLDVLQNLLSDEEAQSHDDMDSVTTIESDEGGEEFVSPAVQQHGKFLAPPRPQKKRGRKPKIKRGPKPKTPTKSPQTKRQQESHPGPSPTPEPALNSSVSETELCTQFKRKRSHFANVAIRKRPRKSSVQSQTLSVTRISVPIHRNRISPKTEILYEDEEKMKQSPTTGSTSGLFACSSPNQTPLTNSEVAPDAVASAVAKCPAPLEKKPRSLRVSLNIPDEVEPGSPMEKVKMSQKLLSPKFALSSLPLWKDDPELKSAERPPFQSPPIQSVSADQSGAGNQPQQSPRSSSPKNEAPLTPFTASALPLQAGNGDRKRKSEEGEGQVGVLQQIKKAKQTPPSTPDSSSDDVFTSPKDPLTLTVQPQSLQPSTTMRDDVSLSSNIVTETPVGYGAAGPPGRGLNQATAVTTQPLGSDKINVGVNSSSSTTTTTSAPTRAPTPIVDATDKLVKQANITPPIKPSRQQTTEASGSSSVIKRHTVLTTDSTVGYTPVQTAANSGEATTPLSTTSQFVIAQGSTQASDVVLPSSAAAVSVITSVPSSTATTVSSAVTTSHEKSSKPAPKTIDNDIIITSIGTKPRCTTTVIEKGAHILPSYTEAVHGKSAATSKSTPTIVSKARPQSFCSSGKQATTVTAKIVEIPVSQQVSIDKQHAPGPTEKTQKRLTTGSVVKTVHSQSPVSAVLTTPTAYSTQPVSHSEGSTYTIVPAEAVAQGGQRVAIAMPPTRSVKPGTLNINDSTAIVVQQPPSQPATQVQYIIEPVPTVSTSVVYTQTTNVPATSSQALSSSSSVYRAQVINSKSLPVTTTKPFAIVPAQPTVTPIEIQSIAVDQRGTPVISPQLSVGYGAVPSVSYIQTAVKPGSDVKQAPENWSGSSKLSGVSKRISHSSGHQRLAKTPDEQAAAQIDEISKKIGEAFTNSSEKMLITAFEDAWKKFQENGKRYPSGSGARRYSETVVHTKPIAPPNAEVVSVPGASSRLSLIRPTYSRSKISALQSSPDRLVRVSDAQPSVQEKPKHIQYVYYSDGPTQPQRFAVSSEYPGKMAVYAIAPNNAQPSCDQMTQQAQPTQEKTCRQVHTSGVYVPARATDLGSNKQAAIVLEQVPARASKTVVQTSQQGTVSVQKQQQVVQHMSVLRKSQPVVGSEEYAVMKRKSSSSVTGKIVHQCALCSKEATYLCSGCRRIWYCGKDCQLKAWDEHGETCKS